MTLPWYKYIKIQERVAPYNARQQSPLLTVCFYESRTGRDMTLSARTTRARGFALKTSRTYRQVAFKSISVKDKAQAVILRFIVLFSLIVNLFKL